MESGSQCTALHVIAVSMVDICTLINSEIKKKKKNNSNKSLKLTVWVKGQERVKISVCVTKQLSQPKMHTISQAHNFFSHFNMHLVELMDLYWIRSWLLMQKNRNKYFKDILQKIRVWIRNWGLVHVRPSVCDTEGRKFNYKAQSCSERSSFIPICSLL